MEDNAQSAGQAEQTLVLSVAPPKGAGTRGKHRFSCSQRAPRLEGAADTQLQLEAGWVGFLAGERVPRGSGMQSRTVEVSGFGLFQ